MVNLLIFLSFLFYISAFFLSCFVRLFFFSLTIFSIQSTHGLLSVDDDFQKYYLTCWRREAQLFLKCDWSKPVKLCIIPILLLHDCCGMLKKSCVINLKVTHSPEILSWSVFLYERANMSETLNHFCLYWSPCVCFCSHNILKNWLMI